jgi:hypothetical protein
MLILVRVKNIGHTVHVSTRKIEIYSFLDPLGQIVYNTIGLNP